MMDQMMMKTNPRKPTTKGTLSYFIRQRITKHDTNFNLGVFGMPGEGKSIAGFTIARSIDKNFNIKKDIVYNAADYFERADGLANKGETKGKVLMLDEAAELIDAQRWFDQDVKNVVNEMRTNRWQNMCCIVISPSFKDVASRARGLLSGYLIPNKQYQDMGMIHFKSNINYEYKYSSWNYYHCEVHPVSGDDYRHLMRMGFGIVRSVKIKLPKPSLVAQYKEHMAEYKTKMRKEYKERALKKKLKEGSKKAYDQEAKKVLKEVEKNKDLWITHQGTVRLEKIQNFCECGERVAKKIKARAQEMIYLKNKNDEQVKKAFGL